MKKFSLLKFVMLVAMLIMGMESWATTYSTDVIPTKGWSSSNGGTIVLNGVAWTYSSATYLSGGTSIQVGSATNPQATPWTISAPISSFGAKATVKSVEISAKTKAASATYDICVGGTSKASGDLTTDFETFAATDLNVSSGDITITLTGSSTSAAMYLESISITYLGGYTEIFYESFDTSTGTGGNDNQWSGSIASSDFKSVNDNWTVENAKGASKCAKFGTTSGLGSATTPAINYSGNAKLTFKAGAWNGSSESTTLKLSIIGEGSLSAESVTLTKGGWQTYEVELTGLTAESRVKFEGQKTSNSRFFLDEIRIFSEPSFTEKVLSFVANDGTSYWATFSSDKDVFVEEDAMPYVVTVSGDAITMDDTAFDADDIEIEGTPVSGYWIPANTGVLLQSTSDEVFYWTVENIAVDAISATNMLRPASVAKEEGNLYYMLAYGDEDLTPSTLGFYWGAEEGAAFVSREGSAYLAVPVVAGAKAAKGFSFKGVETAIKNVEAAAESRIAYNLAGQRVDANAKGMVIMNGRKFINK